jgi:hypothetical protein
MNDEEHDLVEDWGWFALKGLTWVAVLTLFVGPKLFEMSSLAS